MSHKPGAVGELGYLAKYRKCKEGNVVADHVFTISSGGIFYLGQAITVLHSSHY
jgi:hypothetical protein